MLDSNRGVRGLTFTFTFMGLVWLCSIVGCAQSSIVVLRKPGTGGRSFLPRVTVSCPRLRFTVTVSQ